MGAQVATPLAVALNELLQNAVEHAFTHLPHPPEAAASEARAEVKMLFERNGGELFVRVSDNGAGWPDGFTVEGTSTLGLSIVRGLVNSQLGGTIEMFNDGGAVAELTIPVNRPESNDLAQI